MDEAYVVHSYFKYDGSDKRFGILVSTRRLLELHNLSNALQADATYKLVWEGFPVLTGGVSDTDRHFHPTFLAVTEGEK